MRTRVDTENIDEINQLYRDAIFFHFIKKGYSHFKAEMMVQEIFDRIEACDISILKIYNKK